MGAASLLRISVCPQNSVLGSWHKYWASSPMHTTVHSTPTILAVDDSCTIRRVLTAVLQPYAHVHTEASALQAVRWLGSQVLSGMPPLLVLCDMNLPGMSGEQMLAALRAFPGCGHVPFIAISGADDAGTQLAVQRTLQQGAYAFLPKPLNLERLLVLAHLALVENGRSPRGLVPLARA